MSCHCHLLPYQADRYTGSTVVCRYGDLITALDREPRVHLDFGSHGGLRPNRQSISRSCAKIVKPIQKTSQGKFSGSTEMLLLKILKWIGKDNISNPLNLFFCRNGSRYQYTALEPDSMGQERMELERKARQHAQNACQHYLRFCPRYALLQHLNDIGSR